MAFREGEVPVGEAIEKDRIIKSLNLLRAVVAEKVDLDKKDFGLCPFHDEKTRSFHIFVARRSGRARFHCFGCGAGGDIFNYLRLSDNLDFISATIRLSEILNREISTNPTEVISSSRAPEHSETCGETSDKFCERDCLKYANLRTDYEILLEENETLRQKLGMSEFRPSNETQED